MVIDGLGGLPAEAGAATELESARTPTMDRLAATGETGLITPVTPGVTPGSGPAHLALFGYDPLETVVGRGVLAALGVGFELRPGDVAARINLCSLDEAGHVIDRRAGRIGCDVARPLIELLDEIELGEGVQCMIRHVKQYRACVVLRGAGLDGRIADTDPQRTGVAPLAPRAMDPGAEQTAAIVSRFVRRAHELLAEKRPANGVLLRGFDTFAPLPGLSELYGLRAAAAALYPMYRGVARLVGMQVLDVDPEPDGLCKAVHLATDFNFVYLHFKDTDSRGEDGDFASKVTEIERADRLLADVLESGFDVVVVTGDHSTPATLGSHSWHPVPLLIWSERCRSSETVDFGEVACCSGSLGQLRSTDVVPLALAHAGRLGKYGA